MKAITLNELAFYFECAAKFHSFLIIKGLFHTRNGSSVNVRSILIQGAPIEFQKYEVTPEEKDGNFAYRFVLQVMTPANGYIDSMSVRFDIDDSSTLIMATDVLAAVRHVDFDLHQQFVNEVGDAPGRVKLLDIGGRARSGVLRAEGFPNIETTVIDIVDDAGVDIVVDAHNLTSKLDRNQFDFCMCISVFEHLIMPWKAVLEVNKVMKTGGLFLVATHQTVGLHDMPWDYYRFSDSAWDGLFNKYTGFEIVNRSMTGLNFITPFCWSHDKNFAELACGYESSVVLVRKTGDSMLSWPVVAADLVDDNYPQ